MLATGLAILLIGVILLVIALRGRVVARGRFCRGCRFDLAGLDPDATPACPECGRSVETPRSTRPLLRRASRPGLLVSVVLLLTGVGLTAAGAAGSGPRLMAALPDSAVLLLHQAGLDAGLTEVATRSARTPPFRDPAWPRLIEQSLGFQADRTKLWDVRHGDILANAYAAGRMSEPQIARYLHHGYSARLILRDRALHGRPIPFEIEYIADRLDASLPVGGSPPVTSMPRHGVGHAIRASGLATPPAVDPADSRRGFRITGDKALDEPWISLIRVRGEIGETTPWHLIQPGDDLKIFLEIGEELIEHGPGRGRTPMPFRRFERTIRAVSPDTPVVTLIEDAALAARMRAIYGVGPLRILGTGDETASQGPMLLGAVRFKPGERQRDIAGTVFVISDGVEHPLGQVVIASSSIDATGFGVATWRVSPDDLQTARATARAWALAGSVDLVFRSEPGAAYQDARIGSVLRVDMVFKDVPVQVVGSTRELSGPDGGIRVPARAIGE